MQFSKRPRAARVALVALASLAALLAAQVSPAQAKSHINVASFQSCAWNTAGSSTFNSLARLAPTASFARTIAEKQSREPVARPGVFRGHDAEHSGKKHEAHGSDGATIKVYYHVVTDGAAGQLTNAQLLVQTAALDLTYAGRTLDTPLKKSGVDTKFRFVIGGIDRTNNAHWYAQDTFDDEIGMKQALKKGGPTDLNVYTTSGGSYLGWAYYPDIVTDPDFSFLDGIVIDYRSMPGPEAYTNYGKGYTLTHEAGHWLGLAHTFNEDGTCDAPGDFVDDTPFELTPTSGCPAGKDTCPQPGFDPIHNYMDYSYDTCYDQFTKGQSARMDDQYTFWRVHLGQTSQGHH